jgi:hypothetical protein
MPRSKQSGMQTWAPLLLSSLTKRATTPVNRLTTCRSNQIVVQQSTERGNTICQPQLVQHSTNNSITMQQAHIACQVTSHTTRKIQSRQIHQLQVQSNVSVQEHTTRGNTTCQPHPVQHSTNNNINMQQAHIACQVTSHTTQDTIPANKLTGCRSNEIVVKQPTTKGHHNLSAKAGTPQHQEQ